MKLNSIVIGGVILGAVALSVHSQSAAPKAGAGGQGRCRRHARRHAQHAGRPQGDGRACRPNSSPCVSGWRNARAELQTHGGAVAQRRRHHDPEAQQKLNNEIAAKKKTFDRDADDLNAEVEQEDGKLMQDLTVKMGGVIDEYAKQNSYTVVMDATQPVLWAAETANITPDIVKLYDQKHPAAAPAAPPAKK